LALPAPRTPAGNFGFYVASNTEAQAHCRHGNSRKPSSNRGDLMECFSCGTPFDKGVNFCGKCGRDMRPKQIRERHQGNARASAAAMPAGADAATIEARRAALEVDINARLNAIKSANLKRNFIVVGIFGVVVQLVGFAIHVGLIFNFVMLFVTFIAGTWACAMRHPSKNQYYTLPGSKTANGEHRCAFCGNKGIYKHGAYKDSRTFYDCSKCEQLLYVS
jgi:predicted RNA-binding Zn-ribbon protein involved in translation (DUF1610 family)